jgi:hypothetical protein
VPAGSKMSSLKHLCCLAAAMLPLAVGAAEDVAAEAEIKHLIAHLGASGCQFYRNGSWYSAERAVDHLTRKYEYLRKRGLVPDAEAFIERAATESSASGKPYQVRCAAAPAVPSARWLREELERYRGKVIGSGADERIQGGWAEHPEGFAFLKEG